MTQNQAIRGALRRLFARSPVVREVMLKVRREVPKYNKDGGRSKKDSVQYQCAITGEWVGSTHVQVDHKVPVIAEDGTFVDWNTFIERLFCAPEHLQVVSKAAHQLKTNAERTARLTIQYNMDLDYIEQQQETYDKKALKKHLTKYVNKKKTKGLEAIAERASKMKSSI